jgi:hypothetical protein
MKNIIFLIIIIYSHNSSAQISNEYFTVTSATSQGWSGGAYGSGGGINYYFYISFNKDAKIRFDSVWITNGNSFPLTIPTTSVQDSSRRYKTGENISLFSEEYFPGERDYHNGIYEEVKKGSLPPINYKGAALIRFYVNNKPYYYTIDEMQILAPIAYP